MTHFGDITKIHGADVPPVDAVIGGSPCQGYAEFGIIRSFPSPVGGRGLRTSAPGSSWNKSELSRK